MSWTPFTTHPMPQIHPVFMHLPPQEVQFLLREVPGKFRRVWGGGARVCRWPLGKEGQAATGARMQHVEHKAVRRFPCTAPLQLALRAGTRAPFDGMVRPGAVASRWHSAQDASNPLRAPT